MRLQTKISMAILPLVALTIFFVGTWAVIIATRGIQNAMYQLIEAELKYYVNNTVSDLNNTLNKHGLSKIESFVEEYQRHAIEGAKKIHYFRTGHLLIMTKSGKILFSTHDDKYLEKNDWEKIANEIIHQKNEFIRGQFESDRGNEIYIGHYFQPWEWTILYAISSDELYAPGKPIRNITLMAALFSTALCFLLIFLLFKKFVIQPVTAMKNATVDLAERRSVKKISLDTNDELGILSRNMEDMAHAIQDYQDEQEKWQSQLEQKIKERTKNLIETEERHRRVVNTIQDGIFIADNDGFIKYANSSCTDIYQYSQSELLGMHALNLIHPEYHQVFQSFLVDVQDTGTFSGETIDVRKDGTRFFTDVRGAKIKYKGQECLLAVIRDISERKKYEKRLSYAAKEWQSTFDATNSVIWLLDKENRILRSNKMAESVFELPVDSIIGEHCWKIVHETDEPIAGCPLCNSIKSMKRESSELKIASSWYEVTVDPIPNADGEFEKAVHILTDITERKQAELLLKEREQLYRSLFENNISVILLIDPKTGNIFDANPSASVYYGYPITKLKSMQISQINVLSKEEIQQEMQKAQEEKRNYFNFRHRLADRTVRDVEVYSGPISVGGVPLLCSIIHDISERKTLESEREELIGRLQKALNEIKTLKGIVPICSSCKKIRDDKGYWNILESYIQEHSEASFSHGMCPECSDKFYGDQDWYIEMKKKKGTDESI